MLAGERLQARDGTDDGSGGSGVGIEVVALELGGGICDAASANRVVLGAVRTGIAEGHAGEAQAGGLLRKRTGSRAGSTQNAVPHDRVGLVDVRGGLGAVGAQDAVAHVGRRSGGVDVAVDQERTGRVHHDERGRAGGRDRAQPRGVGDGHAVAAARGAGDAAQTERGAGLAGQIDAVLLPLIGERAGVLGNRRDAKVHVRASLHQLGGRGVGHDHGISRARGSAVHDLDRGDAAGVPVQQRIDRRDGEIVAGDAGEAHEGRGRRDERVGTGEGLAHGDRDGIGGRRVGLGRDDVAVVLEHAVVIGRRAFTVDLEAAHLAVGATRHMDVDVVAGVGNIEYGHAGAGGEAGLDVAVQEEAVRCLGGHVSRVGLGRPGADGVPGGRDRGRARCVRLDQGERRALDGDAGDGRGVVPVGHRIDAGGLAGRHDAKLFGPVVGAGGRADEIEADGAGAGGGDIQDAQTGGDGRGERDAERGSGGVGDDDGIHAIGAERDG